MKIKITKAVGNYADDTSVGKVHIIGYDDRTACGLALEEYDYNTSTQKVSCTTCIMILEWCRSVTKKVKDNNTWMD
jgi:hypothetical protein